MMWLMRKGTKSDDRCAMRFALCADRAKCEQLCADTEGCTSFDMHKSLPRCFLNVITPAACEAADKIVADKESRRALAAD